MQNDLNEVGIEELSPKIKKRLDKLADRGNMFEEAGMYDEAIREWQEGLDLIPEPQQYYSETVWFLAAIGDVQFQQGMYSQAHECFDKARGNMSGEGYTNPFIMLRFGECCLEIGDEKNALEYLLRAYMLDGEKVFSIDDNSKYFDFLKSHIDLDNTQS